VDGMMFGVVACELLSSFPSLDIIALAPIAPMAKPRYHASILAPLYFNASSLLHPRNSAAEAITSNLLQQSSHMIQMLASIHTFFLHVTFRSRRPSFSMSVKSQDTSLSSDNAQLNARRSTHRTIDRHGRHHE
jgi:hypothetical protein